jgi:hypothetical protein
MMDKILQRMHRESVSIFIGTLSFVQCTTTTTTTNNNNNNKSVALVRERTIPTERPPLVGEVSANFCG